MREDSSSVMMNPAEVAAALDLFDAAPCGYLFTAPDGMLTKANRTFLQWTGYEAEDILNRKRFMELLSRPAAIFYETHFAPLLRMQGFVREITVDFVRADGSTFPALVNSNIHRDSLGEPLLVISTIFDFSERRRYERELLLERRRAEQWALVVANSVESIMTADSEGKLNSWNRGAEATFGYTPAEALGQGFRELLVQKADADRFEAIVSALRAGQPAQQSMFLRHKNGGLVDASVSFTPYVEPVDEYAGFAAIVSDLQMRRKVEKAKQMARDLEIVNQLAHEINNPLQAIVNCIALASSTGSMEYVDDAKQNVTRIADVITRLADVARK